MFKKSKCQCAICNGSAEHYKTLKSRDSHKEYEYFICKNCESIFIAPDILQMMDSGEGIIPYNEKYWEMEKASARERCFGAGLSRMAEAIFYTQIPINNFLDIGTGTGYFLDAVSLYLPSRADCFFGVEKFPPIPEERTQQKNYYTCDYKEVGKMFDCGICVEVIEHLTPEMLKGLFREVAEVSNEGALYVINSGLSSYTQKEDASYIDPFIRGHIVSYSVKGVRHLLSELGFTVHEIKGKTWAFAIEYKHGTEGEDITERVWKALPENLNLLNDDKMGTVMQILGRESIRAYL